ncbi:unnamed protein product [Paramecium sonneborni]|uniref:Uncharacterized protein n=1 Tax=Paramecium sonneborni TaxID=65129 RepID=A0A8S1KMB9_9CILI|nr:unnamed protein product [Paramecium sonneborni]
MVWSSIIYSEENSLIEEMGGKYLNMKLEYEIKMNYNRIRQMCIISENQNFHIQRKYIIIENIQQQQYIIYNNNNLTTQLRKYIIEKLKRARKHKNDGIIIKQSIVNKGQDEISMQMRIEEIIRQRSYRIQFREAVGQLNQ